jgi:hypothetical protein
MNRRAARPSPSFVISCVALFVALSAAAVALPGRNSVNSGDVRNEALKSQDVRNQTLTAADIADGSLGSAEIADASLGSAEIADGAIGSAKVADGSLGSGEIADDAIGSAKVADDSLTGADVNESSLAEVPLATSAGAISGVGLRRFSYQSNATAVSTEILNVGGLVLFASCPGGSDMALTARTTVSNAFVGSYTVDVFTGTLGQYDDDVGFNVGENFPLLPGANDINKLGHAAYYNADRSVFVDWVSDPGPLGFTCQIRGTATVG